MRNYRSVILFHSPQEFSPSITLCPNDRPTESLLQNVHRYGLRISPSSSLPAMVDSPPMKTPLQLLGAVLLCVLLSHTAEADEAAQFDNLSQQFLDGYLA